ncbi:AMP-binding protein [Alkalihalobacillus sp. BA299]|uniref:AMP-binding enzyme n=1 Tax=Alkalihalobacillus sp. BA299 TaxID=2815938 RepID=UPI001ADD45F4
MNLYTNLSNAFNHFPEKEAYIFLNESTTYKELHRMVNKFAHSLSKQGVGKGDMATMDEEGYFYIVDRKKDMINVGGYNVYPREIEEVLYDHPDIVEAAVIGVPDESYGEAVKAFVVSKNETLTEDELKRYFDDKLVKYKRPKFIEFLSELPKNTTGKILRKNLRNIGQQTQVK